MTLTELEAWLEYSHSSRYPGDPKSESFDIWFPRPDLTHENKINLFRGYFNTMESYLDQERQKNRDEAREYRSWVQSGVTDAFNKLKEEIKAGRISSDPETVSMHEQNIMQSWPVTDDPEEYWLRITNDFADTIRKSFFVNLYSFWETQLFPLCNSLKHYDDMPSQNKKKKNFGHLDAYPFLEKIGFDIRKALNNKKKNKWELDGVLQNIDNYRIVRNCIVHNAGYPHEAKDEEKLREYIRNEPLLSLNGDRGDIQLYQEFCDKTLKTIEKYFDELLEKLAKWNPERIAR